MSKIVYILLDYIVTLHCWDRTLRRYKILGNVYTEYVAPNHSNSIIHLNFIVNVEWATNTSRQLVIRVHRVLQESGEYSFTWSEFVKIGEVVKASLRFTFARNCIRHRFILNSTQPQSLNRFFNKTYIKMFIGKWNLVQSLSIFQIQFLVVEVLTQ